ncbi:MAG TPA: carbon-nitrogen hydrolase family protein [Nocardioidaceae bacterium]|nr:carbon-nitrogen hydrolase family protein [Nocardioidaceae bacterium]
MLRVAAAQATSVPGDIDANVATAVSLVVASAERGARVVVLPELFLTGYDPGTWSLQATLTPEDPRLAPLRETARQRAVVVLAGAAVRRGSGADPDDPVTLSLLVVGPDGGVTAPYDKQHLFDTERKFFTAGDHGASVVVDGWELGLGICYDGCFPEHAAAAARDGARAYLCPSAYFVGSDHRRDLYYAARALDNGIYVVFSGLVGPCGDFEFSGGSAVYDPEGRPLARAGDEAPAVVVADLDPAEVGRVQEMNPIGRDRLVSSGTRNRLDLGAR